MHINVEFLSWGEVEALGYFQLSDMKYDNRNMVTERVSATQPAITCSKLTIETLEQGVICSKLTIKTHVRRHWRHSGVFIVNFKQISGVVLVFLLLTLNIFWTLFYCFYC